MIPLPTPPIHYTAIGDSITVGIGALFNYGFAYQYRDALKKDLQARIVFQNAGKSGITSRELLQLLRKKTELQKAVASAQVITCSIGGNDLLQASNHFFTRSQEAVFERAFQNFRNNLEDIHDAIKRIKSDASSPYMIRYLDLYNPFPDMKFAVKWVKRFNGAFDGLIDKQTAIAPVYAAFLGQETHLLFLDHKHPNMEGHRVIARAVQQLGYYPIR
ncbi:GDSL-type esterase/lipase family protein [Brevibacillus massiliensis]|uniref:GDSL-type esterase/lipase family protein n=1 Tax=Brevibacillus massiliensis TaxID=1118054 RepID=UPI00164E03C6|nr:GDSL-type esterase/lipase family protein [Brevibacillus massiliensis]